MSLIHSTPLGTLHAKPSIRPCFSASLPSVSRRLAAASQARVDRGSEEFHEEKRRQAQQHTGVTWRKPAGKFQAHIKIARKFKHLGYYTTVEEASAAFRAARSKHPLPEKEPPDFHRRMKMEAAQHRGVAWEERARKFRAQIGTAGQKVRLGFFRSAEAAGVAAEAARCQHPFVLPPAKIQSEFTGVAWHSQLKKWEAYCQKRPKQPIEVRVKGSRQKTYKHLLGFFDDELEAAHAVRVFLDAYRDGWRHLSGTYLEADGSVTFGRRRKTT